MLFTTNKSLSEWGKVLYDEDLATAILDRILERGRLIHLDGPSGRTRHLNLEEALPDPADVPEFPEFACQNFRKPQHSRLCVNRRVPPPIIDSKDLSTKV
jgi:hypothetical protein